MEENLLRAKTLDRINRLFLGARKAVLPRSLQTMESLVGLLTRDILRTPPNRTPLIMDRVTSVIVVMIALMMTKGACPLDPVAYPLETALNKGNTNKVRTPLRVMTTLDVARDTLNPPARTIGTAVLQVR